MAELTDFWALALRAHWGLEAKLVRLDGEYDLNFLAKSESGQGYIAKVMRPDCPEDLIDLQVAALGHLAATAPDLPVPDVVANKNGDLLVALPDETGQTRQSQNLSVHPAQIARTAPPATCQKGVSPRSARSCPAGVQSHLPSGNTGKPV